MSQSKWIREWLEGKDWARSGATYCPKCGRDGNREFRYCPWCGEKMDGEIVVTVQREGNMYDANHWVRQER